MEDLIITGLVLQQTENNSGITVFLFVIALTNADARMLKIGISVFETATNEVSEFRFMVFFFLSGTKCPSVEIEAHVSFIVDGVPAGPILIW